MEVSRVSRLELCTKVGRNCVHWAREPAPPLGGSKLCPPGRGSGAGHLSWSQLSATRDKAAMNKHQFFVNVGFPFSGWDGWVSLSRSYGVHVQFFKNLQNSFPEWLYHLTFNTLTNNSQVTHLAFSMSASIPCYHYYDHGHPDRCAQHPQWLTLHFPRGNVPCATRIACGGISLHIFCPFSTCVLSLFTCEFWAFFL